jgi:hypothetical protein
LTNNAGAHNHFNIFCHINPWANLAKKMNNQNQKNKTMNDKNFIETQDGRKRRKIFNNNFDCVDPFVILYHTVPFLRVEDKCNLSMTNKIYHKLLEPQIVPEWIHLTRMLLNVDTLPLLNKWIEISDECHNFIDDWCSVRFRVIVNLQQCWQRMKNGEKINFDGWIPLLRKYKWIGNFIVCSVVSHFYDKSVAHDGFFPLIRLITHNGLFLTPTNLYRRKGIVPRKLWHVCGDACPSFKTLSHTDQQSAAEMKPKYFFSNCYFLAYPLFEDMINLIFENYDLFSFVESMGIFDVPAHGFDITDVVTRKDVPIKFVTDYFLRGVLDGYIFGPIKFEESWVYQFTIENGRHDIFMKCFEYQQHLFFQEDGFDGLNNVIYWCTLFRARSCFEFVYDLAHRYAIENNDALLLSHIAGISYPDDSVSIESFEHQEYNIDGVD